MKARIIKARKLLEKKYPEPDQALRLLKSIRQQGESSWPVFYYMGMAYLQRSEFEAAAENFIKAIENGGDDAETWFMYSHCLYRSGDLERALQPAEEAVTRNPDRFEAWMHLGALKRALADLEGALKAYQQANRLDPASAEVALRIGMIYKDQGDTDKAVELLEIALKIRKDYSEALGELASIYDMKREYDKAGEYLEQILSFQPDNLSALVAQAELSKSSGSFTEAIEQYRDILKSYPDNNGVRTNLALCLQNIGRFEESEVEYKKALESGSATPEVFSNYLMSLHYNPEKSREEIYRAHLAWDDLFAPKEERVRRMPGDMCEDRPLRLGLVSDGFRRHPVGWMIIGALENLDPEEFSIHCYSTSTLFDPLSSRIRDCADSWRSVIGYDSEVIAKVIEDDGIDILIDLSGHASGSKLPAVALEPAPVSVKWVGGLFNTTGLESMDYLISDHFETPSDDDVWYTEKLVRMPNDYVSFTAPEYAPDVNELPAVENGYITFGCFNNPSKINPELLERWAGIMNRVPDSRLFLKSKQYTTADFCDRIRSVMAENGIEEERIIFEGESPHNELLEKYNLVDIALDPWPYSGGLSTCEALWMGVPVVTYPGPTFAGRHSYTHLVNAGYPELVASDWTGYEEIAVELASDYEILSKIRKSLRENIAASPLCDHESYGAALGTALRTMWKQRVRGWKKGNSEWAASFSLTGSSAVKTKRIVRSDSQNKEYPSMNEIIEETLKELTNGSASGTNGHSGSDHSEVQDVPASLEKTTIPELPEDLSVLSTYVWKEQSNWLDPEIVLIKEILKPGMKAIDVGASFGLWSIPMADAVGEEGMIWAFDGHKESLDYLDRSAVKYGYKQLQTSNKLLGASCGDVNWNEGVSPELSTVDTGGPENSLRRMHTLDFWWDKEGSPEISLLKVDTNKAEVEVLKGGLEMLSICEPVVIVRRSHDGAEQKELMDVLRKAGYSLFSMISDPALLISWEDEAADPYLQNIIALPAAIEKRWYKKGLIFDTDAEYPSAPKGVYLNSAFCIVPDALEAGPVSAAGDPDYLKVLDLLCTAEELAGKAESSASVIVNMRLQAARILIDFYNRNEPRIETAFTLSRVMLQLGKRAEAVAILKQVLEGGLAVRTTEQTAIWPFMLPLNEQYNYPEIKDIASWLTTRSVEAWVTVKDLTTYMSSEKEGQFLSFLADNDEVVDVFRARAELYNKTGQSEAANKKKSRFVHLCFNHVYAASLSDLLHHVNSNSDQEHRLYVELHRAIENYDADLSGNPLATKFDQRLHLPTVIDQCLDDEVDGIFFHGLFFPWQRQIIEKVADRKHIGWIIWGGDLYKPINTGQPFYELAKHIDSIHGTVEGDKQLSNEVYGTKPAYVFGYPYPGLYGNEQETGKKVKRIIIGNSGDPSNDHGSILRVLAEMEDISEYELFLPVAYNFRPDYEKLLNVITDDLGLSEQITLHKDFLSPDDYRKLISESCMLITAHDRQQAVGNMLMSVNSGNPTILRKHITVNDKDVLNPAWEMLSTKGFELTDFEDFSACSSIAEIITNHSGDAGEAAEIIRRDFGLERRAGELTQSCESIRKQEQNIEEGTNQINITSK